MCLRENAIIALGFCNEKRVLVYRACRDPIFVTTEEVGKP